MALPSHAAYQGWLPVAVRRFHSLRTEQTQVNECNGDVTPAIFLNALKRVRGLRQSLKRLCGYDDEVIISLNDCAQPVIELQ
jgi:hypothetical protein